MTDRFSKKVPWKSGQLAMDKYTGEAVFMRLFRKTSLEGGTFHRRVCDRAQAVANVLYSHKPQELLGVVAGGEDGDWLPGNILMEQQFEGALSGMYLGGLEWSREEEDGFLVKWPTATKNYMAPELILGNRRTATGACGSELILGEPLFSGVHDFEVMGSIITRLGATTEDLAYLQSFGAWTSYKEYQQANDPPQEINPVDWPLDIPQAARDLILIRHQVLPCQYSLFIKYLIKYQMAMAGVREPKIPALGTQIIQPYRLLRILAYQVTLLKMDIILFTSESVNEGHPDKLCDQISDAVLDACLEQDPDSKVALKLPVRPAPRPTWPCRLDADNRKVLVNIEQQSPDIAQGVHGHLTKRPEEIGAEDQGHMFGYATDDETPGSCLSAMFLLHSLVHVSLMFEKMAPACPWLRPDGKTQVTVEYYNDHGAMVPLCVHTVLISTQHDETYQ
ncbi:hypothetical protein ACLB2K_065135 [Fragaria x ananassa]